MNSVKQNVVDFMACFRIYFLSTIINIVIKLEIIWDAVHVWVITQLNTVHAGVTSVHVWTVKPL